jgi:hypothetical protein
LRLPAQAGKRGAHGRILVQDCLQPLVKLALGLAHRLAGISTSRRRALRLMREHGLLAQVSSTSSVWQRSSRFGIARM